MMLSRNWFSAKKPDRMELKVTFWGVRGSFPCATPQHMLYGGNTSCVSVEAGGEVIILDAGTGLWQLGKYLVANGVQGATMLMSHTHTDHIIGFPFFAPAWIGSFHLDIFAGHLRDNGGVRSVFAEQMRDPIFPVSLSHMAANMSFHDFDAGEDLFIGNRVHVKTAHLNHPNGATGYRISTGGRSICYVTDTEHYPGRRDPNVMDLVRDADVMIYDSTYSDEEYARGRVGWGHSTWEEAIRIGQEANVGRVYIFHHDPDNTDDKMAAIERQARSMWDRVTIAREGMAIEL